MEFKNLEKYVTVLDNELMQIIGDKPIKYTMHCQFRNTASGEVRLFERSIKNSKYLEGKELEEFLRLKLEAFIAEKESGFIYSFIPYECAEYRFPTSRKKSTWTAKCFYTDSEKETHKMYLKLAQERAKEQMKLKGVL